MPYYRVEIAGTEVAVEDLDISEVHNGRGTIRFKVRSEDGSYRPAQDALVEIFESDTEVGLLTADPSYAGLIVEPEEGGLMDYLGEDGSAIITDVDIADLNTYAEYRVVNETISGGEAIAIGSSEVANPGRIHTLTPHGCNTGDTITIVDHSGSTPDINGDWVVTVIDDDTLSIPTNITVAGTFGTLTRGTTLGNAMRVMASKLSTYGVTLDPAQDENPSLPMLVFEDTYVNEALDLIAKLGGNRTWNISATKVLGCYDPTGDAAPYNVVAGNGVAIGDVRVKPTRKNYANRIIVRAGSGQRDVTDEVHTGDGATRVFPLDATVVTLIGTASVNIDGDINGHPVGVYGVDDMAWTFEAATNSLHQKVTEPVLDNDDTVTISYTGTFPLRVQSPLATAEPTAEQTSVGLRERVIAAPDIFTREAAQALADAELSIRQTTGKTVVYKTYKRGIRPGMTQTITVPARNINNSFLVTEVSSSINTHDRLEHRVTAIEGSIAQAGWRDVYKAWGGGASSSATSISGAVTGGGSSSGRYAYFLGGSNIEFVRILVADTYQEASASFAVINTVTRGTTAGTVIIRARSRLAGPKIFVELWNLSDEVQVGEGIEIDTASLAKVWVQQSFSVELTAGTKIYVLRIKSDTVGADVAVVGYLE